MEKLKAYLAANKKKSAVVAAALVMIPYLSFQNMKERKAAEAAARVLDVKLDDRVEGVSARFNKGTDTFTYQDGSTQPADGLAFAVLTADDIGPNAERFAKVGYVPDTKDFPVVVFYNPSGFDNTGDPSAIRRAKDGSAVFRVKDRPPQQVAGVTPNRDGSFRVFFRDGTEAAVPEDAFYRAYMGTEPADKIPTPAELDKMSDDELKKLGLTRMPRAEYEKKNGALTGPAARGIGKGGIKGTVIEVGGVPPVKPLGCTVMLLGGAVRPTDDWAAKKIGTCIADEKGHYSFTAGPGTYTVVVLAHPQDKKPRGNAVNPAVWPAVTVGEEWLEYEFRVPAGR